MKDKYGTVITEGTLLVCKENTGPVPGRVWLGVAVADDRWKSGLVFRSANMEVVLHEEQAYYWQVVIEPKGCELIEVEAA